LEQGLDADGEASAVVAAFFAALAPSARARLRDDTVERALIARATAARDAWFPVEVPGAALGAFLGERVAADAQSLAGLSIEDLYLTCACARGDRAAIERLEACYFGAVRAALARMRLPADAVDELQQRLREQLFVGPRPRIAEYRGRGALASWLSVSAVRAAYKLVQRETRPIADEDDRLAQLPTGDADLESGYVKRSYGPVFKRAFIEALDQLGDREKNLLRQHYLDGLTLEQLAALQRTHRATVARWLGSARQELLDRTRDRLMRHLRVPLADCDSIIRLAQSQLELTLMRLLAPGARR
jgi:RNA polymerase sigma-70 factor (ECF subfamily)